MHDLIYGDLTDIKLSELSDAPEYAGNAGKIVKINSSANGIVYGTVNATEIVGFPASYSGQSGKSVTVKQTEDSFTYEFIPFTRLLDTPQNYTSAAGKFLRINDSSTGIIYVDNVFVDALSNFGVNTRTPNIISGYIGSSSDKIINLVGAKAVVAIQGSTSASIALVNTGATSGNKWMSLTTENGVTKFSSITDAGNANVVDSILSLNHATGKIGAGISPLSKFHVYENTSNTGSTAGITIEQAGAGDALLQFNLTGTQIWTVGVDNSDADKLVIGRENDWGTGKDISIDTSGAITIGRTLGVPLGSAGSPSLYFGTNTSTGIWSPGINTFAISTGGVERIRVDNSRTTISGDILINGTTTFIDSTTIVIEDPVFALGGRDSVPEVTKDRGIEFKWDGVTIPITNYIGDGTTAVIGTANTSGYATGDIITISGATGSEQTKLNGTWPIAVESPSTFSFTVTENVAIGIYTTSTGTTVKSKDGFFGLDQSTGEFTFIPQASNNFEVFSGIQGTISANILKSTVATGTAPLTVASSTGVTNLNADYLDGHHSIFFSSTGHIHPASELKQTLQQTTSTGNTTNLQIVSSLATGTAPFVVASSTGVLHLNADLWDGYEFSDYLNQNVKTTASPTFTDVTLSSLNRNSTTYGTDTKLFTGVPWGERGKFKVAFTYSAPNIVATISFVGANTSFSYYINGKKFIVTSTGVSSTGLAQYTKSATAAEGTWYFYINQTTTDVLHPVMSLSQTPWNIYDPDILLWNAYYNATNSTIHWIGEERHTAGRDIYQHARNHAHGRRHNAHGTPAHLGPVLHSGFWVAE